MRNSGSTGSSIVSVAEIATTTAAQMATGRDRSTTPTATGSVSPTGGGTSSQMNPSAPRIASPATSRNGARMPPASYIQPPIDGPTMKATLVPDITMPLTRPRSSGRYRSAISAKPTTQVIASAAPCTRRAANSHGRPSA